MNSCIKWFEEISLKDLPLVGGKNASLGELTRQLKDCGVRVPQGFAVTVDAYEAILDSGSVRESLEHLFSSPQARDASMLTQLAQSARAIIKDAGLPQSVKEQIISAYHQLSRLYGAESTDVAIRSSATAEDLPDASFAGQQESFLNIQGESAVLEACLNCFASLFTERAISYRHDKGFEQLSVRLSVAVQKMVRSDLASSGVLFTIDTESGFRDSILITSSYGLGENIVSGRVDPDEFLVFKPTLRSGHKPILRRKVGAKQQRLVYATHGSKTTSNINVPDEEKARLSLSDEEVILLSNWALSIEDHYSSIHGNDTAMDIEWAKDGRDGQLYIVQARPETVFSIKHSKTLCNYSLNERGDLLLEGRAIGERIGSGPVRLIRSKDELGDFQPGEILVADMTDPDWEPIMKRASAIITNRGGRTCHAAIVSRELGVPCVVGTHSATDVLQAHEKVTVCCAEGAQGKVYKGLLSYTCQEISVDDLPQTSTKILINVGEPDQAFSLSQLPVEGVGLARVEFIIANELKIHPLALTRFESLVDEKAIQQISQLTRHYPDKNEYFVNKLAEGVSVIAAAFYPRPVIVRLSDFKTNEYANLVGGKQFEPKEDNPMIGFRGASRYYSENYKDGFALECRALKSVRDEMGLTNVKIMVPFCRTVEEGRNVLAEMSKNGLTRGENGLEVYVMCEIPANVILADAFSEIFDGFSIGSNDLTQLVLGIDRDSELVAPLFDERNLAVKRMIEMAIREAKKADRKIGICGQAPSDYPEFAQFLVENGIDSISLNPDAVLKTIPIIARAERVAVTNS